MTAFTTRPEIAGSFGVVSSTHWLATATGMSILEQGGNAFDAVAAAGFVLQVVEPHMNGPGGEVPSILRKAGSDDVKVICGQGTAPAAATIDAFHALGLDMVPGNGLLPAVVPGAFGAWLLLIRDYGSLPLRQILEPAIAYARNGHPVVPPVSVVLNGVKRLFEEEWKSSAELYLPNGEVPQPGSLLRHPELAQTYERILAEAQAAGGDRVAQIEAARRAWYEGFVAETVDAFCRETPVMDTSGERHRGLLTADDMAVWRASVEAPTQYEYCGYTVFKTGPWGQGPVFLQQLALLKGFDLGDTGPDSAEFVHIVTECAKLALADRDAYYGDPDFVSVPLAMLLSDAYNEERRRLVANEASYELRPGEVPGHRNHIIERPIGSTKGIAYPEALTFAEPEVVQFSQEKKRLAASRGDTCHLDVIDRHGNMVAATPSGGWLHASPVIPGLGWGLTPRGEMFWLDKQSPSALAPRKRPRTTLTPSLAFRDGEPYMVFGTPGGDQQDQWAMHAFLRHVHFGLNLQASIDAPEFHTKHLADSFFPRECDYGHLALEGRFSADTIAALDARGHNVEVYEDWVLGHVCMASRGDGLLKAGASPRFMQGYAAGR